ncbi:PREDICTED: ribonuclease Z, mitochondrial [Vollenhovia emeryi]|uniref:ribonuclease Z, mitochondrial n=1 Tax=Vollenhovia emeryi TaxID=411798 RepID=UPI0005F4C8E1|nr:PREDICTED: ribonuclease Z, mitochondrial [Vollenhovia emeryi]
MRPNARSFVYHVIKRNYRTFLLSHVGRLWQNLPVPHKQFSSIRHGSTMPRSVEHMLGMQRLRQKIKEKSSKYTGNAKVSLQILGSGAYGTSRCVYLTAGHTRYIFNCGEGTQRLAFEHKYKLSKLEHVFITSATWSNMGGMPGMLLTIQDAGVPKINVHGPKGTVDIFHKIKQIALLQALKIYDAKCDESEPYLDPVMSVSYVSITKPGEQEAEPPIDMSRMMGERVVDNINYYDYKTNANGKRVPDSIAKTESKVQKVEQKPDKRISSVMSYICKLHPRAGTLCLNKCLEKGVKPGPLLGELKAGNDITLPDGTVVLSKDVCSPATPGPIFIIVECPSEDYLEPFVNHPAFTQHQTGTASEDDVPCCIIHFTPQEVIDDSRYVNWMGRFGLGTRHIVVNEENECMGTEAVHRHQHKLHMLHPEIFPFLNEDSFQKKTRAKDLPIIHRPRTHHTVHLQPHLRFDTKLEVSLHPKEYVDEVLNTDGILDALAELQTDINARTKTLPVDEYPKIVMLGTGSSIPSKVRNTSGILLRVDKDHTMLLDCGEGTFGQMVKIYGRSGTSDILKTIKAVYVSHMHADHHIGLIGLLRERKKVTDDPLYLFAPGAISTWLQMYHKRFESILHRITLISNSEFFMDIHISDHFKYRNMYEMLNVQAVKTVYVKHCPYSYGVSVTLHNGQKIVYSGDTMPCENLVKLGQNCDLLIHEATMEDDLLEEAKLKVHSTVSQAIEAGEQMKSKFTLLTHFSQRYAVIPHLSDNQDGSKLNNVGIAYDNMHISMSQLPLLPLMYPTLKIMFNKHYLEIEDRAARRQRMVVAE